MVANCFTINASCLSHCMQLVPFVWFSPLALRQPEPTTALCDLVSNSAVVLHGLRAHRHIKASSLHSYSADRSYFLFWQYR